MLKMSNFYLINIFNNHLFIFILSVTYNNDINTKAILS